MERDDDDLELATSIAKLMIMAWMRLLIMSIINKVLIMAIIIVIIIINIILRIIIIILIHSGLCGPSVLGTRLLHLRLLCLHQGLDGGRLWRGEIIIMIIIQIIINMIMRIILTMTRWTRQPVSAFRAALRTAQSSPAAMLALVIRDGQVTMMMMIRVMSSDQSKI